MIMDHANARIFKMVAASSALRAQIVNTSVLPCTRIANLLTFSFQDFMSGVARFVMTLYGEELTK